jgi:hypothetical protein
MWIKGVKNWLQDKAAEAVATSVRGLIGIAAQQTLLKPVSVITVRLWLGSDCVGADMPEVRKADGPFADHSRRRRLS